VSSRSGGANETRQLPLGSRVIERSFAQPSQKTAFGTRQEYAFARVTDSAQMANGRSAQMIQSAGRSACRILLTILAAVKGEAMPFRLLADFSRGPRRGLTLRRRYDQRLLPLRRRAGRRTIDDWRIGEANAASTEKLPWPATLHDAPSVYFHFEDRAFGRAHPSAPLIQILEQRSAREVWG
jgi:hypothetical protein